MRQVIVFLKAPVPGLVKTRLIPALGREGACAVYERLLDLTLSALEGEAQVDLRYDPPEKMHQIARWVRNPSWRTTPQGGGNLGDRIDRAFHDAFQHGADKAILVGSDCPALELADIEAASARLENFDVVLGPAMDGGYWLIGARASARFTLDDVRWSTEHALVDTIRAVQEAGLSHALLRQLRDVDEPRDLELLESIGLA